MKMLGKMASSDYVKGFWGPLDRYDIKKYRRRQKKRDRRTAERDEE